MQKKMLMLSALFTVISVTFLRASDSTVNVDLVGSSTKSKDSSSSFSTNNDNNQRNKPSLLSCAKYVDNVCSYSILATSSLWAAKSLQVLPTLKALTSSVLVEAPTTLISKVSLVGGYVAPMFTKATGLAATVSAPVMSAVLPYAGCLTASLLLVKTALDCYKQDKETFNVEYKDKYTIIPSLLKLPLIKFGNNVIAVKNAAVTVAPYVGGTLLAGLVLAAAAKK